jgi:hypothetical protein
LPLLSKTEGQSSNQAVAAISGFQQQGAAAGTPLALIELRYYMLAKNSREPHKQSCAIFRSLFCARKHCLDNMFVAEEAFAVFKYMNYLG